MMCARRSSPPERVRRTDAQNGSEKHRTGARSTKRGAVVPLGWPVRGLAGAAAIPRSAGTCSHFYR